jgi:hypothetical protein
MVRSLELMPGPCDDNCDNNIETFRVKTNTAANNKAGGSDNGDSEGMNHEASSEQISKSAEMCSLSASDSITAKTQVFLNSLNNQVWTI